MKKIYLVIAGAFLILLIIISILLSLGKKSVINTSSTSPFPTGISLQESNQQNNRPLPFDSEGLTETGNISQNLSNLPIDISTIAPVETEDFKLQYSPKLNKIVVEKKTPQAEELFYQWINQNQLNEKIDVKNNVLFTDKKIIPTPSDSVHKLENKIKDFFQLMDDLNNIGKGTNNNQSSVINISLSSTNSSKSTSTSNNSSSNFTYYAQCGDYGNLSLPDGCNLCSAGCGPTTVAMIAASYLGSSYNPKTIVDIYKSNGYLLGCEGSLYSEAKQVLQNLGLKTTDYLNFNGERADTVVPELKKYLNAGWTFFTLTRFCDDPKKDYCGHFFWITDVDSQNNIWAYDPYYGRYEIPYNENSRYPYPLYLKAFGVKK